MTRNTMNKNAIEDDDDENDEFFGNQSDNDNDSAPFVSEQQYGNLANHEHRSKADHFFKIGYLEAYDESKDTMLQDGFEAGYRQAFSDSKTIGMILGNAIASDKLNTDKEQVAYLVRNFLETEQQKDSANTTTTKRDGNYRIFATNNDESLIELISSMKSITHDGDEGAPS